jgi:signal transduction histidine kinase
VRTCIIFTWLFFSTLSTYGQSVIDSLENLLEQKISDQKRVDVLNHLSRELSYVQPARAGSLANEAVQLAKAINYKSGVGYAYRILSSVYSIQERFSVGMEYMYRALDIFDSLGDSVGIANCYITLGHMYRRQEVRDKEITYHKMSYEIFTRVGIAERIGVTAHNLGESYFYNQEYEKAEVLTRQAIRINDSIRNKPVLSSCYKVMGFLAYERKDYATAENYFKQVVTISQELGVNSQKTATAESLLWLSYIYRDQKKNDDRIAALLQALPIATDNGLSNLLQTLYLQIIEFYVLADNPSATIGFLNQYNELVRNKRKKELAETHELMTHALNEMEEHAKLENLEHINALQEELLARRRGQLIFAILSIGLLGGLAVVLRRKVTVERAIKKELEELNEVKNKFFGIVAHDLKSPLNTLKSYTHLITRHIDHLSKEELIAMGSKLEASVDNTLKLSDNLIAWARVQMKEYERKPSEINLSEIAQSVCALYQKTADQKNISLCCETDENLKVFADENQVMFVVRNLVNNAIKFTNSEGSVIVKATASNRHNVDISVTDTGTGIPEEVKQKLFSVGNKISVNGTAGEKGTGLGLTLCYEFVQLNGGTMEIESQEGVGSTFYVRLPVREQHVN